ncbi:hypothetical protein GR183_12905 [Stappia sp. GBMRC 2046]|uniref:Uracil DNA glycosylase superfamily protein n=1 Tax=Stappia sediminis TaxID=2692190 RepID=A0A7X3S8G0_9HYPH|nr:hypothetical protein [Stappia sediminis]MXN65806.1 hypothetical protein [Stappia sediminis]
MTDAKKAPPEAASDLAPGEAGWMYPPMAADVREVLDYIGPCRDGRCPVPKLHPYYHAEVLVPPGEPQAARVPCMPVVPVQTDVGGLMVIGDYPTARFTARGKGNTPIGFDEGDGGPDGNQFFVPIADIWAPMQDASYFDGYKVRAVASGTYFARHYMDPAGLGPQTSVWMTNLIKCYLFHQQNVDAYRALGWTDIQVEESYTKVYSAADVCWKRNLVREIDVARPKLVITVGEWVTTVTQGLPQDLDGPGRDRAKKAYMALQGVPLRAGVEAEQEKTLGCPRIEPFFGLDMMHLLHPERVMIAQTTLQTCDWTTYESDDDYRAKVDDAGTSLESHLTSMKNLNAFLSEVGLVEKGASPPPDKALANLVAIWKAHGGTTLDLNG